MGYPLYTYTYNFTHQHIIIWLLAHRRTQRKEQQQSALLSWNTNLNICSAPLPTPWIHIWKPKPKKRFNVETSPYEVNSYKQTWWHIDTTKIRAQRHDQGDGKGWVSWEGRSRLRGLLWNWRFISKETLLGKASKWDCCWESGPLFREAKASHAQLTPICLSEGIRKPFALSRAFFLSSGGKSVLLVKGKAPSRSGFPLSTYIVLKTRHVSPNIHVRRY